ncbi:zf-HC2 domain-containing protein [Candidatus Aminicenantes bacterium AC-335-K20]|jgi:hypothetical protein|nr:zf-HC2 domain-containing protein [SCandidatus Aminicenantes bacterium Aminicenantia_JdfR_composite]MCP2606326.1 zf-HC2 domain-containing protein [Candidatus Aminicenantes bacterium AC-708-I09]MCP2617983.1 zf-HC2 domain-containing protein [Candidatus Aminicenantes bacterium AC-335-A11]MCP2619619.1 zf-HC2 domain-containing protein [Candidatus Aminicenantes bacterium AC-335-K20]
MPVCKFIEKIDDYLLDKLGKKEKEEFEIHFFNCPICAEELILRSKVFEAIKERGREIFSDVILQTHYLHKPSVITKFAYFFKVRKWAYAFLFLFVFILSGSIYLSYKLTRSQFLPPSEEAFRGETLALVAPQGEIQAPPSIFMWEKRKDNPEYILSLYNEKGNLLWEIKTRKNKIKLPAQTKNLLKKGNFYFWEVKAISSQGSIIARSRRAIFKF